MKKLLVLMLVLGMASVANAHLLTWSEDAITIPSINATVVVQLIGGDGDAYPTKYVGQSPAIPTVASVAMIIAGPAAGEDAVVQDPTQTGYPGWWTVEAADFPPGNNVAPGSQYSVTIKGLATGTWAMDSDDLGQNDVLDITVVPEPMTVALLGLGGMFMLRRRKK